MRSTISQQPGGPLGALREQAGRLADLRKIGRLLRWDQAVMMPPAGAEARAAQLGTLAAHEHELLAGEHLGALLEAAAPLAEGLDAALVRTLGEDRDRALRVPAALASELTRAAAAGQATWIRAHEAADFSLLRPTLERNVALARDYAACFPDAEHPYDALLDRYARGMRLAEARDVLGRLRDGLVPLLAQVQSSGVTVDGEPLWRPLPAGAGRALVEPLVAALGADAERWRVDDAPFAFVTGVATRDVRITTRYADPGLAPLLAAVHELGHGLYEQGFAPALDRTTLDEAASALVHESQSLFWEHFVARGEPFWQWCFPRLAAAASGAYRELDWRAVHRAANAVEATLIRVDADPVTYGLHVAIRFELEVALVEGTLAVADLPAAWDERYRELLGIEVPNVREGVLQDVHWSSGMLGYFPCYALGYVLAGQLWARARAALPALDEQIALGDFAQLREWLRVEVHDAARRDGTPETTARLAGGRLDPDPLLAELRARVHALYGP